jgi:hypothetical protein
VLDGFVLTIDDFDVGERVAFNWFLLDDTLPIGTAAGGNAFGFGTIGLMRGPGDMGPMFVGNSGFGGGQVDFFGNVGVVPAAPPLDVALAIGPAADESTTFLAEFGAGITAPFSNPTDNTVDAPINTTLVSEPGVLGLLGLGGLALAGLGRRRR